MSWEIGNQAERKLYQEVNEEILNTIVDILVWLHDTKPHICRSESL